MRQWQQLGLGRADGKPFPHPDERAYLLVPAGTQGPGFLMLHNFRVIMRYNPAEAYALAIGHLADRLRGGGPFVQAWPRDEKALSRGQRLELQELLAGTASTSATRTAGSGPGRGTRSATSRRGSGGFRTALPPPACWSACAPNRLTLVRVHQTGTFELTFFPGY